MIVSALFRQYGSYFRTTMLFLDNMTAILERRFLFLDNMAAILER
jgi:hypothetical protein